MKVDNIDFSAEKDDPLDNQGQRGIRELKTQMDGAPVLQATTDDGGDHAAGYMGAYFALVDPSNGNIAYLRYSDGKIIATTPGGSDVDVVTV